MRIVGIFRTPVKLNKTKHFFINSSLCIWLSFSCVPLLCSLKLHLNSRITKPSNVCSRPVSGEHPAAIQYGGQLRLQYPVSVFLLSVFVALIGSWIPTVLIVLPCFFWCRFNVLSIVQATITKQLKCLYCEKNMSSRTTGSRVETQCYVSSCHFVWSLYPPEKKWSL